MAWNEPGKSEDPWGNSGNNGGGDQKPPKKKNNNDDIDELLKKAQNLFGGAGKKFGNNNGGDGVSKSAVYGVIGVVLVGWLATGIYKIDPAERGVVTQFGKFVEETTAGPHWHIPYPIETVVKVNVDQIRTAEIGYRSGSNQERSVNAPRESLMLTKDENIVDLKIAIQYQVQSANQYLFDVSDPDLTLRAVVESTLREVVGQNTMDFVLTEGRNEVVSRVQSLTQERLNAYKAGLVVTSVNLQDAQPPEQVQSAFADVVKAREDRERLINEAETYSNDILPKSRGMAARELEEASAYHDRVIAEATGQASRFTSIVKEYKKAPEVTRNRLYIDAVSTVLSNTSKVFMGAESSNNMLFLPLDKMMGQGQSTAPLLPAQVTPAPVNRAPAVQQRRNTSGQRSNIRDILQTRELR